MLDWRRRPVGRLFYWTLALISAAGFRLSASGAAVPPEGGAPTTTVTDTVYLADGTPAAGNLIISWPAFVTGGGTAVAAGTTNVALGTKGSLSVELGAERGSYAGGCLLQRRVSDRTRAGENRILGGAICVSCEPGDCADDAGIGTGGAAGIDAIREFGSVDQGGRYFGCACEWGRDDQRD